jgi:RHS repeat-associated protein
LNSVTALVSTAGVLANTYSYDPWGQTIASTGTATNPWQFTSSYNDTATGLYLMGARYDQPASGRFTQQDPLPRNLISLNRYAYAGCNPANFTDPTGLTHCDGYEAANRVGMMGVSLIGVALTALTLPTPVGELAALGLGFTFHAFALSSWSVLECVLY